MTKQNKNQKLSKENELRKEISDLQAVRDHFGDCPIWKEQLAYLKTLEDTIDSTWMSAKTPEEFYKIQSLKNAIYSIKQFPVIVAQNLQALENEIEALNDTSEKVEKDFDA